MRYSTLSMAYLSMQVVEADGIHFKMVDAYRVNNSNLLVHRSYYQRELWALSHDNTGLAIKHGYLSRRQAVEGALAVIHLTDWSFTKTEELDPFIGRCIYDVLTSLY